MQHIEKLLAEYQLLHKKEEILNIGVLSIGLVKKEVNEEDISLGSSKFGGLPDLPPHISYPKYHHGHLNFLAQINMQEAKPFDEHHLLPDKGILYFFYDAINQPWGLDSEDKGCFKVIYFDGESSELKRTPYPEETDEYFPLPAFKMTFDPVLSFPEECNEIDLNEDELDNFYEFRASMMQASSLNNEGSSQPMHYMLGEPFNIQGDVFEEIVYYTHEEKIDWDSKELKRKSNELVLLFQMDSDEDLDVMWGDVGIIYFCIDKNSLLEQRLNETKFTLQCS